MFEGWSKDWPSKPKSNSIGSNEYPKTTIQMGQEIPKSITEPGQVHDLNSSIIPQFVPRNPNWRVIGYINGSKYNFN